MQKNRILNENTVYQFDGEKLKSFRESKKLTQTELARMLNISPQVISRLEASPQRLIKDSPIPEQELRKNFQRETANYGFIFNDDRRQNLAHVRYFATAPLKYKLLKVFGYDIESNKTLFNPETCNFTYSIFVTRKGEFVTNIPYYINSDCLLCNSNSENDFLSFDKRWLENSVHIQNTEGIVLLQSNSTILDSEVGMLFGINDDDILMIDKNNKKIEDRGVYAFTSGDKFMISMARLDFNKRLRMTFCKAGNVIMFNHECEFELVGRVIWNYSKGNLQGLR